MLTDNQEQLWGTYLRLEELGIRKKYMDVLAELIESLEVAPRESWRDWALEISCRVVDGNESIPVRSPFFQKILFPALLDGYRSRQPGCARWLAAFETHLCDAPNCRDELGEGNWRSVALLRAALELDPADRLSRHRLIDVFAKQFEYSLHELPAGVLDGGRAVTADACPELRADLAEFCQLVEAVGLVEEHAELIDKCQYHYSAYQTYLENRDRYADYPEYLESHKSL